jgi:hypothetical protein
MPTPAPKALPSWYMPEDHEAARFARAPAANSNASPDNRPLPSWYTAEDQPGPSGAPPLAVDSRPLPSWYTPELESVTVTADKAATPIADAVGDFAANVGTGVARVPGAIIGLPHMLNHTLNWLQAKAQNLGDGGNRTGADIDKTDPIAQHTLSSEEVDNGVFKGVSAAAGREVHPYEPTSFIGKLLQAGVTGAGAGMLDPLALLGAVRGGATGIEALKGAAQGIGGRMARTAVASDAANVSQQAFPDEPGLAALAALVAHAGASAGESVARAGGGLGKDAVRQVFSPTAQGELAWVSLLERCPHAL